MFSLVTDFSQLPSCIVGCPTLTSWLFHTLWNKVRKVAQFSWYIYHLSLDLPPTLARIKFQVFVCVSVSWFIWSLTNLKVGYLLSFQDNFTKIYGHLSLDLSHRLPKKKFEFWGCVSVSWFICSLWMEKWDIFLSFQEIFYQTWWTSSPGNTSQIG